MVQDAQAYAYTDATYAIFPGVTLAIIVGLFIALGNTLEAGPVARKHRRRRFGESGPTDGRASS
jgi:ABC-type dipeptide/oligopeptide/nickel transport system permease subunit